MEEKFFKFEQLKVGELIEGYFIKSESEVNKRLRFLQEHCLKKKKMIYVTSMKQKPKATEAWNRRAKNA